MLLNPVCCALCRNAFTVQQENPVKLCKGYKGYFEGSNMGGWRAIPGPLFCASTSGIAHALQGRGEVVLVRRVVSSQIYFVSIIFRIKPCNSIFDGV